MSSYKRWSEKDLVSKWGRSLPPAVSHGMPWEILTILVESLSQDTLLPREDLLRCISQRDLSGLFDLTTALDVTVYTSPDLLLQDRLVCELFSKFDFPSSPFNKEEKAKLRFAEAEVSCREANFRIKHHLDLENDVNGVIHRARRIIDQVLGSFKVEQMLDFGRFGPGSTLCVAGPFTTEYFKLCEKNPTVTPEAFPYAEALLAYDFKWKAYLLGMHPLDVVGPFSELDAQDGCELSITDFNKVAYVPKNAKTLRSIAIEPYFNIYFQLGVGGMIRNRLFKVGIDLSSQVRNQMLAKYGSLTGKAATIDFKMASDTLSVELVRLLMPPEWFAHLDRLRSKNYLAAGKTRRYEKFSSMGNGYTFELETLIFYSLALASCQELDITETDLVSIFGDDVVMPTDAADLFIKASAYLGLTTNEEKTFLSGSFRESCGEDFLNGCRVRPVFCKELRTVQHVASLANRLLALNRAVGPGSRVNDMLYRTVDFLHRHVPRDVRELVVGPPSDDVDGYIHTSDFASLTASPLVRWNRNLYCWEYPTIRFRPIEHSRRDGAAALWINWGLAVRRAPIPKNDHIRLLLRGGIRGYSELTDFINEAVPRQVTGRKIGRLSLGHSMVWQLPR